MNEKKDELVIEPLILPLDCLHEDEGDLPALFLHSALADALSAALIQTTMIHPKNRSCLANERLYRVVFGACGG